MHYYVLCQTSPCTVMIYLCRILIYHHNIFSCIIVRRKRILNASRGLGLNLGGLDLFWRIIWFLIHIVNFYLDRFRYRHLYGKYVADYIQLQLCYFSIYFCLLGTAVQYSKAGLKCVMLISGYLLKFTFQTENYDKCSFYIWLAKYPANTAVYTSTYCVYLYSSFFFHYKIETHSFLVAI